MPAAQAASVVLAATRPMPVQSMADKVEPGLKLLSPWAHTFTHQTGPVTASPNASSLRNKALAMHGQPFLDKLDQVAGRLAVDEQVVAAVLDGAHRAVVRLHAGRQRGGGQRQVEGRTAQGTASRVRCSL